MGEFDAIRAKGIALIKRKGRDCSLLVTAEGSAADASQPWRVAAGTLTAIPFKGATWDCGTEEGTSDKYLVVPGDISTAPDTNMRIQMGSFQYSIVAVEEYNPDGTPIGFKLRIRAWPLTSSSPRT